MLFFDVYYSLHPTFVTMKISLVNAISSEEASLAGSNKKSNEEAI